MQSRNTLRHLHTAFNRFIRPKLLVLVPLFFTGFAAFAKPTCQDALKNSQVFRTFSEIHELKVMAFNVENLFISTGKAEWTGVGVQKFDKFQPPAPKSEADLARLREVIDEVAPDFAILTEVESIEALNHLNEKGFSSKYKTFLIEGNDLRGIDIGFMVKADLPFAVEQLSFKDSMWFDPVDKTDVKVFARDLPVLLLKNQSTQKLMAMVVGFHAKSKRDRPGDPESTIWRTAEYQKTAEILIELKKKYPGVPIIMGGDFNTQVNSAPEAKVLNPILQSAFSLTENSTPIKELITHTYHPRNAPTEKSQMDDLKVSAELKDKVLEARVVRYKGADGSLLPIPDTYDQRKLQPSDHFPIFIRVSTEGLF